MVPRSCSVFERASPEDARLELDLPGGHARAPRAFLSPRSAGDMAYRPGAGNPLRDAWLSSAGFDPGSMLAVILAHSRRVECVRSPGELAGVESDGIVTDNPGACAVVTVADCMPIFLFDPDSGAFGVLHSGWKGTGILSTAVALMAERFGSRPGRLSVCLGPAIGPCCYPVPEERARAFAAEFGDAAVSREGGLPRLDLRAANLALAESLGIATLSAAAECTACEPRLGSYRRQGAGCFTRMAAAIGYPST